MLHSANGRVLQDADLVALVVDAHTRPVVVLGAVTTTADQTAALVPQ